MFFVQYKGMRENPTPVHKSDTLQKSTKLSINILMEKSFFKIILFLIKKY
jgi:hypothetical protein